MRLPSGRASLLAVLLFALLQPPVPALAQAPANDNFSAATVITTLPTQVSTNTDAATQEPGEPSSCAGITKSVWYAYTPGAPTTLAIDSNAAWAAVYSGSAVNSLTQLACGIGHVATPLQAGVTYHIQVGGASGSSGSYSLTFSGSNSASPTPTPTQTPPMIPTATPYPRPNVGVQVTTGNGTLQTTLTARDAGCAGNTENSQLHSLQITRLTNATLDVNTSPVTTVTTAPQSVPLPSRPPSIQLTLRRVTGGQAATAELVVTDGCGTWPTLVGGGPSAF